MSKPNNLSLFSAALDLRNAQKHFKSLNPSAPGYDFLKKQLEDDEEKFDDLLQSSETGKEMLSIPVFGHVMVDIETLSTEKNALILSIAAIEFDLATGRTGESFYGKIDIQSAINAGLTITANTLKWWFSQDKTTQTEIMDDTGGNINIILLLFSDFIKRGNVERRVWGNGLRFDLGILANAYKACNINLPWNNFLERDVRTLVDFFPEIKTEMPFDGVKHTPLADCKHQVKYCSAIYTKLVNQINHE